MTYIFRFNESVNGIVDHHDFHFTETLTFYEIIFVTQKIGVATIEISNQLVNSKLDNLRKTELAFPQE